jgi:hypothetical protein
MPRSGHDRIGAGWGAGAGACGATTATDAVRPGGGSDDGACVVAHAAKNRPTTDMAAATPKRDITPDGHVE